MIAASDRPVRNLAEIASFHAHVYFDPGRTDEAARTLRAHVAERFAVQLGRWHDAKVGPHGKAMFQIAFAPELFGSLVPWLMLNHAGLSILIHPNTLHQRQDHVSDSVWIGERVPLNEEKLPELEEPELPGAPNTEPQLLP
jgi:aromatic ring-cleaving dioxygenase